MPAYLLRPGAWLSGAPGAGATPIGPPGSGGTPIGPPGSGGTPIGPPGSGGAPQGVPMPTAAPMPLPWNGMDAEWTYRSPASVLAQAIRKSRAKVVPTNADRLTARDLAEAAQRGRPIAGSHLWRWASEFRISAVQCEILGRFQVRDRALWMIGSVSGKLSMHKVFEIPNLPAEVFSNQVDKVLRAAVEREDRLPEILSQADDTWPFYESIIGVNAWATPRLQELLAVAHGVAIHLLMAIKHQVAARRPFQLSTLVVPVIPTPGHGSLPSGHATIAALDSELLGTLLYVTPGAPNRERRDQLDRLARRIAFNRVVAGVHFPVDSLFGYAMGTQLARLLIALASGSRLPSPIDEQTVRKLNAGLELPETAERLRPKPSAEHCAPADTLAELWKRTKAELNAVRL